VRIVSRIVALCMLAGLCTGELCFAQDSKLQGPGNVKGAAPDASKADVKPQDKKPPSQNAAPAVNSPAATPGTDQAGMCEVPSYLLATENSLTRVAAAIKARQPLNILVVGSASSILAGADGASASYPARLEAALRERLKGITVNVSTDVQVKKTAAQVAEGLEKLAKDRKPGLVVWQTGTVDALQSVDLDDFRTAIDDGIAALVDAGADVLLMNLQYSPRMETMISVAPYLDNMRVGAEEHNVPLFDRFAMMRQWNESGRFDLFNSSQGFGLAKRVHDCLGQALATFIVDAARINAAELGTTR
jgi:hypothetical protein